MNVKEILKFLFPEYQIIQAINKHGLISTNKQSNVSYKANLVKSNGQNQYKLEGNTIKKPAISNAINSNSIKPIDNNSQNNVEIKKLNKSWDSNDVELMVSEINTMYIGQTDAAGKLLNGFKRSALTGIKKYLPRNTIFLIGDNHSGRSTLVKTAVQVMNKNKRLDNKKVTEIDLSLYSHSSTKSLFLSDIYKALYNKTDVVVFRNYNECDESCIYVINQLVVSGLYKMEDRYGSQNKNLVKTTDMLMKESISEISANNKFFIFLTSDKKEEIAQFWGQKFMNCVGDIVELDAYSYDEIWDLANIKLNEFKKRSYKNQGICLTIADNVLEFCVSLYNKKNGIEGLYSYIERIIYAPVVEYVLQNSGKDINQVDLYLHNDELVLNDVGDNDVELIYLKDYTAKTYNELDEVKKELDSVVGLNGVKEYVMSLEDNYNVQIMREEAGYKAASISKHMIFTGNPGTGKTTIARIVAKYLKAIGVLSNGQLREVSRADLVGQYVGHTAQRCNEVIKSALGGVLFIDEAYSLCRDKNDTFGLEAIDALVKAIEDYRDDLVVILAGYKDEMEDFLEMNSGLKSRFPNYVEFEDYTPSEMVKIADIIAKSKGYKIEGVCHDRLNEVFEKSQIKGRNDSGNGRLVRNIIENAILEQSKRLIKDNNADMALLIEKDFKFDDEGDFDLEAELSKIIGLENVKRVIREQNSMLIAAKKRKEAGITVDTEQSLNMIFTGNPGTGKTMVARLVASMLKDMGVLKKGHLIETDKAGLVGEYAGQAASKTKELFEKALGGVLFIDEAYTLSDGSSHGKEVIDTLVKLVEDYRGDTVVILAGYKKEMSNFLKTNKGLYSRFPFKIEFPDYNLIELTKIACSIIDKKGFFITDDAKELMETEIARRLKTAPVTSGNGRMIRNVVEEILRNQSYRIATTNVENTDLVEILPSDIYKDKVETKFDLEDSLANIIGLDEVKDFIRSLYARLKIESQRKDAGLVVNEQQTLHMIFKGNPGTGKTMIARKITDLLFNIGILSSNKLVETDRAGLVAGYVGQTAIKTQDKVMEALGGVLFIDEAYSLAEGGANDFGKEAIDTLVKLIDDKREQLVVILAGYSDNMDKFVMTNPGLKSRFPNVIEFADYDTDELMQIAELVLKSKGYSLSTTAKEKLQIVFSKASKDVAFGNGRYVRNIIEASINRQALRLMDNYDLTKDELITIEAEDIDG